ncbi:MAG TPA: carbohydrate kinase [Chthoniobacterales bacterium]
MKPGPIFAFGEVLWDCLPSGIFLGGAPVNVAYHLHRLGGNVWPVSAVGADFLGEEILRRLRGWGLPVSYVSIIPGALTGAVIAGIDASGSATYDFRNDAAWDRIGVSRGLLEEAETASVIIFGTLAFREKPNREALAQLLAASPNSIKVCDINLRPPFDDMELAESLMRQADLIKLNDAELIRLAGGEKANLETMARELSSKQNGPSVCVTAGAQGAGLLWNGEWYWSPGRPVVVKDTVGAGDSFLAALVCGLLVAGQEPAVALARACRLGEFVASCNGATPAYRATDDGGFAAI